MKIKNDLNLAQQKNAELVKQLKTKEKSEKSSIE